jgi:hypothetical protein
MNMTGVALAGVGTWPSNDALIISLCEHSGCLPKAARVAILLGFPVPAWVCRN